MFKKTTVKFLFLALILVWCVACSPKVIPMDAFSLEGYSQVDISETDEPQMVPLVELEVEVPLEIALPQLEVEGLTLAAQSSTVTVEVMGDLLVLTGTTPLETEVITLTLEAEGYDAASYTFAVSVAPHQMMVEFASAATEEGAEPESITTLELTEGDEVVLPLIFMESADLVLTADDDSIVTATLTEDNQVAIAALAEGDVSLLLTAALTNYDDAFATLDIHVEPKPVVVETPAKTQTPATPVTPAAEPQQPQQPQQNQDQGQGASEYSDYMVAGPEAAGQDMTQIINDIVSYTNKERAKYGLPALKYSSKVSDCAAVRAYEASINWAHVRPGGTNFSSIFGEYGLNPNSSGENLHYSSVKRTGESVTNAWIKSRGHHDNMLRSEYTTIGVGVYTDGENWYYCQLFTS